MTQDLLQLISNEMKGFSKGQKRIGAFILEHYDKAAFMTAAKLGETVGVSESTVVRFAAELGFEGYPQLQKSLQDIIRNRLTTVQRMEIIDEQLSGGQEVRQGSCEWLRHSWDAGSESSLVTFFAFAVCGDADNKSSGQSKRNTIPIGWCFFAFAGPPAMCSPSCRQHKSVVFLRRFCFARKME